MRHYPDVHLDVLALDYDERDFSFDEVAIPITLEFEKIALHCARDGLSDAEIFEKLTAFANQIFYAAHVSMITSADGNVSFHVVGTDDKAPIDLTTWSRKDA